MSLPVSVLPEQRLVQLRYAMVALGLLALAAAGFFGVELAWLPCLAALVLLALANLSLSRVGTRGALLSGLAADVLALSLLLFASGGAANPLASLYLPPVLFAALLAPGAAPWLLGALALACYGALFVWHLPWPVAGGDSAYAFSLHLVGMWWTLALSIALIVGFVSYLSRTLARREAELRAARETQLANEQMVALGVQAAVAAHALSTPLSTLTLLCDELGADYGDDPALGEDLALMRGQLAHCRDALARLRHGAEPPGAPEPVLQALAHQLEGWRTLRPDVVLAARLAGDAGTCAALPPALWPAVCNLLNNAAEAGGGHVEVSAEVAGGVLALDIVNREGCLSDAQLARAGLAPQVSAKPAGLGLGVMLTHVTLSRLGGTLALTNGAAGGVRACVCVPLTQTGEWG